MQLFIFSQLHMGGYAVCSNMPKRPASSDAGPQLVQKPRSLSPVTRRKKSNHFLRRYVQRRKYCLGCKCGICAPPAHKLCAQQTATPLSKSNTFLTASRRKKARRVKLCFTRRACMCVLRQAANRAPVRTQSLTVTTLSATTADASPFGCTVSTYVPVLPM